MSADNSNFDPHHEPFDDRAPRREPGFGADRGDPRAQAGERFADFAAGEETPTLEEAFGLHGEKRSRTRRPSAFERAASALGGAFMGRAFGRAGADRGSAPRSFWSFSWGWGGAWPLMIGVALGAGAAAAPPVQRAVGDGFERIRVAMLARPEFAIRRLEVSGMRKLSDEALKAAVQGGSSERAALAYDYKGARKRIEALGWVERASVVLQPPNTLAIEIVERRPAALWRRGPKLTLIDPGGVAIAEARARSDHPELPLLVGPGAAVGIDEAMRLARIAKSGGLQIGAMTRIGERRWDIELLGGPRLMLPESGPLEALEQAVAMARDAALFERGFKVVDLRLPFAPTARPMPSTEVAQAAQAGVAETGDVKRSAR